MDKPIYTNASFAFRSGKFLVEENITQDRVFELIESFYTPENTDFTIEFWDMSQNPPRWIEVCPSAPDQLFLERRDTNESKQA